MNTFLNYLIESNVALLLFLGIYLLFLKNETNFKLVRIIVLTGIITAIIFPFIHMERDGISDSIPTLSDVIPTYWLPEFVVGNTEAAQATQAHSVTSIWGYLAFVYFAGLLISALLFLYQVYQLFRLIPKHNIHSDSQIQVIEVPGKDTTFSFFNYIFIGNCKDLSDSEKQRIVDHEITHVKQWHSADILLISILKIVFWFNPLINIYKKIFVQLHEFEADARAVENQDVNNYCSLLARVALRSAGLSIANHFNNSLTIKRIQMMRTIKSNIKWWKLTAFTITIPALFYVIACQEQITGRENDMKYLPVEARQRFDAFRQNYQGETFIVEYDDKADKKLAELDGKYGKAKHIELFTITDEGKQRNFSMLQYVRSEASADRAPRVSSSNEVFDVVEVTPEFEGGMDGLVTFLRNNIHYPKKSRENNIEGTSYVSFIVEKDGSVSDVKTINGFDPACDAESERVVKLSSNWKPGKVNGEFVRTRFVLPIKYKL
jgi:TonB family protein